MGLEQRTSVAKADPYLLFGLLSKKIIHPGGRCATEELLAEGDFRSEHRVLDIGCGVATTSLEIARRFGSTVIAADISIDIRERANTKRQARRAERAYLGRGCRHLRTTVPPLTSSTAWSRKR